MAKIFWAIISFCNFIGGVVRNALVKEDRINTPTKVKKYLACNGMTGFVTGLVLTSTVLSGSLLWTGAIYAFASIQKRMAILWAETLHVGWDGLSGLRFGLFEHIKDELIAGNRFATFLSNLAERGVIAKVFQIGILGVCLIAFVALLWIFLRSLDHMAWAIRSLLQQRQQKEN